jgi:hypothetical protein
MKKSVVLLVVVVLSISQVAAQKTAPASVAKLVYPGVVFGTALNSNSCFNMEAQQVSVSSDSGLRYYLADRYVFSNGFRERFMIQYFRVRNRILDHLLA